MIGGQYQDSDGLSTWLYACRWIKGSLYQNCDDFIYIASNPDESSIYQPTIVGVNILMFWNEATGHFGNLSTCYRTHSLNYFIL